MTAPTVARPSSEVALEDMPSLGPEVLCEHRAAEGPGLCGAPAEWVARLSHWGPPPKACAPIPLCDQHRLMLAKAMAMATREDAVVGCVAHRRRIDTTRATFDRL